MDGMPKSNISKGDVMDKKTFADECLWLSNNDRDTRDEWELIEELARRLKRATDALRTGYYDPIDLNQIADELEALPNEQ